MRSLSPRVLALVAVGVALAGADLAVAFVRTGIPREFHGEVAAKRILLEKHPGVDDVCRLTTTGRPPIQVEHELFDAVSAHDPIAKDAWSRTVLIRGTPFEIPWSFDVRGLAVVMPLLIVMMLILARMAAVPGKADPP